MIEKYLVLEASAGSGKTFSLVSRYLSLLFLGVKPERIFALTFTKKATKEMHDRVVSSLQNPKSGEVQKIKDDLKVANIEAKSEEILKKLLNSEIKISTIDSFSNSILKRFAHYLELLPNFQVVENINEVKFNEYFLRTFGDEQIEELLKIQKLDSKIRIEQILDELKILYQKEIEVWKVLERIENSEVQIDFWKSEKHIFEIADLIAKSLLENEKISKSGAKALQFSHFEELLEKTWLAKENLSCYQYFKKLKPSDQLESTFQRLKELIAEHFRSKEILIFKSLFRLFDHYKIEREKFIKREQKFSFDDINHFLVKLLLDKNIDTQFIYFRLDSQIEHILIDEFQDTNILQYKILSPLIDEILSGREEAFKTMFYVGDKMQSLYRFRGAFPYLFDYLQEKYQVLKKRVLPNNFRSKSEVIEFLNRTFETTQKIGREEQNGGFVIVDEVENPLDESISEVQNLIENGISPEDIAVICWKNSEVDFISEKLGELEISISAESNLSLFEYPKVKAIINYLLYLYHSEKIYLKNFQTIIGISPENEIVGFPEIDLEKESLLSIVLKIIEHFEIFSNDDNILKFLEKLDNYGDFDEFIFNYELEGGKAVKGEIDGVQITTIHKSKGLEYPFVIFIDTPQKKINTNKVLYSYERIEAKDILWSFGSSANKVNSRYADAKEEEDEEIAKDTFNRLYVAFSRAEIGLKILKSPPKKTNLPDLKIATFGNVEKSISEYKERKKNSQNFVEKNEFENFDEVFYGRQGTLKKEKSDFDPEQIFNSYDKISFGTFLHLTLEMMAEFNRDSLKIALQSLQNSVKVSKSEVSEIERRIEQLLQNDQFLKIVNSGKVFKEKGYRYKDENFFMDLVVENEEKIFVLDFKSSKKFQNKQIEQVQKYMKILRDLHGKEVFGFLLYLEESETQLLQVGF
jgi:exodeoxyribonuclease V beta subunit